MSLGIRIPPSKPLQTSSHEVCGALRFNQFNHQSSPKSSRSPPWRTCPASIELPRASPQMKNGTSRGSRWISSGLLLLRDTTVCLCSFGCSYEEILETETFDLNLKRQLFRILSYYCLLNAWLKHAETVKGGNFLSDVLLTFRQHFSSALGSQFEQIMNYAFKNLMISCHLELQVIRIW